MKNYNFSLFTTLADLQQKPIKVKQQKRELIDAFYYKETNPFTDETTEIAGITTRPVKVQKPVVPVFHENIVKIGYDVFPIIDATVIDKKTLKVTKEQVIVVDDTLLTIKKDFFGKKYLIERS